MEQEPQSPQLYITVKRVTSRLRLAVHLLFMIVAFLGTVVLLAILISN